MPHLHRNLSRQVEDGAPSTSHESQPRSRRRRIARSFIAGP
jgi:hypothetical protein